VLYTSTFFPDVALEDFREILDVLLGDRRLPPAPSPSTPQCAQSAAVAQGELLRDVWRARSSAIVRVCGLTIVPVSIGVTENPTSARRCVQFADDRCRIAAAESFATAHAFTHLECVEALRRSGLLFKKRPLLADRLISYFVAAASEEPTRYNHRWLLDTLGYSYAADEAPILPPPHPLDVSELLGRLERSDLNHVANRMGDLVRAFLLKSDVFDQVVERFLNQLLASGAHDIVASIAWRLHNLPSFDSLSWLKRLLNEGEESARRRAYRTVRNLFRDGAYARVVFKRLLEWLPVPGADRIDRSARYALQWFLGAFTKDAFSGSNRESASWPPADSLLGQLIRAYPEDAADELIRDLVAWILHPSFEALLREPIGSDGPERWMLYLGRFVSEWLVPQRVRDQLGSSQDTVLLEAHLDWALAMLEHGDEHSTPVPELLVTMILAHWGACLLGPEPAQTPTRGIEFHRGLVRALGDRLDRQHRRRVAAFLSAAQESVRFCVLALDSLPAPVGPAQRAARSTAKRLVRGTIHQVKEIRAQLSAH